MIVALDLTFQELLASGQLILSPLARAIKEGVDLVGTLRTDVQAGEARLNEIGNLVREQIIASKRPIYVIAGASEQWTTPMEYGGHFLELDREILVLAEVKDRTVIVLDQKEPFLDFVCDLPCELFIWNSQSTGVSVAELKSMCRSQLASNDPEAEICLVGDFPTLEQL